jgi:hypothetical protein
VAGHTQYTSNGQGGFRRAVNIRDRLVDENPTAAGINAFSAAGLQWEWAAAVLWLAPVLLFAETLVLFARKRSTPFAPLQGN